LRKYLKLGSQEPSQLHQNRRRNRKRIFFARRVGEAILLESEARLRAAINSAVDAIITIDDRGTIEQINRAVQQMFGYASDELIGKNVSCLMPSPDRERHDGYLEQYRLTGQGKVIGRGREIRAVRKDGTTFAAELAVNEFLVRGQTRFTGSIRDVSERKRAELKLTETESRLRTAIAYDLHDSVGQLLAGARILTQNLLRDVPEPLRAPTRRIASILAEALEHVRRASRNLAEGDAPGGSLVDALHELAQRAEDLFGLRCSVYVDPAVTEPSAQARNQAYLVAQEAVFNTARHSGGTHVAIRFQEEDNWYRLSITDNGRGISNPLQASGLGLASMEYRSRFLGGKLEIQGVPGNGTRVVLCWPCLVPDSSH
jgi:two-component system, LuxR family, sensor kinase FixL